MNIRFLQVNRIDEPQGLEEYVKSLSEYVSYGPATLLQLLTDAFYSQDKHVTAAAWIWVLKTLTDENAGSIGNVQASSNTSEEKVLRLLKKVFSAFNNEGIVLEHFKDISQTCRPIFTKLDAKTKACIFAIDRYMKENLGDYKYVSMAKILEEETKKVQIMTDAYYAFAYGDK